MCSHARWFRKLIHGNVRYNVLQAIFNHLKIEIFIEVNTANELGSINHKKSLSTANELGSINHKKSFRRSLVGSRYEYKAGVEEITHRNAQHNVLRTLANSSKNAMFRYTSAGNELGSILKIIKNHREGPKLDSCTNIKPESKKLPIEMPNTTYYKL